MTHKYTPKNGFKTPLGRKIHEAIVAKGVTNDEVASACHVCRKTVDRWCRGARQPLPWHLKLLSFYLDVRMQDFVKYVGNKHPNYEQMDAESRLIIDKVWENGDTLRRSGLVVVSGRYLAKSGRCFGIKRKGLHPDRYYVRVRDKWKFGAFGLHDSRFKFLRENTKPPLRQYVDYYMRRNNLYLYEIAAHYGKPVSTLQGYLNGDISEEKHDELVQCLEFLFGYKYIESHWKGDIIYPVQFK